TDFLLESHLHPHILHTLELLRNYGKDIAQAKWAISNSPSAPEFPNSEWTSVLSGRAIDLDHVFTGRYTPGPEEPVTEAISGIEFSINHPVAAKRITTCGDWVFAWGRATRATVFAFPHRRDKLVAYGEYIRGLSRALAPAVHAQVLNFDHTVRKQVGSARNLRLTNFESFANLKIQYINSCGANIYHTEVSTSLAGRPKRSPPARQKEACRRWNTGTCSRKASECCFQHVCINCNGDGHRKADCPPEPCVYGVMWLLSRVS
ncbi:hypothetical protein C8Q70DRAFT_929169, partial [Cubamyces menziesii]